MTYRTKDGVFQQGYLAGLRRAADICLEQGVKISEKFRTIEDYVSGVGVEKLATAGKCGLEIALEIEDEIRAMTKKKKA